MMRRNRQFEIAITLTLAFIICACGANARQKTIRITYESTNIAADQLESFTKVHAKAIVDDAKAAGKTKEQASAELEAFLAKADKASLTVRAVYRMVAAAAALNDDKSLAALLGVAKLLKDELTELGVLKGALP